MVSNIKENENFHSLKEICKQNIANRKNILYNNKHVKGKNADVAELADAHDSKSCGKPCGFESHQRHQYGCFYGI